MTTSLQEADKKYYLDAKTFLDLIKLNQQFLKNPTTTSSPYTLKLEEETSPLVENLLTLNDLGFLTTSSSPTGLETGELQTKKRAYLIGFVYGESLAERLERDLNMVSGVIAFKTPCNGPGFDDEDCETSVDFGFSKIPVSFEKRSDSHEWEVSDYVTSFNWWTLLKPVVDNELYHHIASQAYNFYIIDALEMGNNNRFFEKVIEVVKNLSH